MQIRPWDGMGRGVRALITILQGHPPLRLPNVVRLSGLGENLELASGTPGTVLPHVIADALVSRPS